MGTQKRVSMPQYTKGKPMGRTVSYEPGKNFVKKSKRSKRNSKEKLGLENVFFPNWSA